MTLASKSGGRDAKPDLEKIVAQYYEVLYRFAFSLVNSESEASDLTQQTFCILAEKRHQPQDTSKIKTWLFTTLNQEFLKTRRGKPTLEFEQDCKDEEGELDLSGPSLNPELDSHIVLAALQKIDEQYRVPIVLFYMREHTYHEIAEILEMPIGTVKSRISRGKELLYRQLKRTYGALAQGYKRVGVEK